MLLGKVALNPRRLWWKQCNSLRIPQASLSPPRLLHEMQAVVSLPQLWEKMPIASPFSCFTPSETICSKHTIIRLLQGKLRFANSVGIWIPNMGDISSAHQNSDVSFGASSSHCTLWTTRSWKNSGWKGSQGIFSPTSCSKQGELWYQTRLLSAYTITSLEISTDGHCITSLGNLVQCPASLMVKNICLISCLNLSGFNLCIASVLYVLKFAPELSL